MSGEPGGVVTPVFSTWSCGMYDVEELKKIRMLGLAGAEFSARRISCHMF
jgi:hypothetical protein